MSGPSADTREYEAPASASKGRGDGARRIGDIWQRLGTNGDLSGTSGKGWRTFLSSAASAAVIVAVVCVTNVMTMRYEQPQWGLAGPIIWEGTSWFTLMAFLWIGWVAYRLAPPLGRPRWRLLVVHPIGAVLFSLAHVAGFVLLRKLIYAAFGTHYDYGAFWPHFSYEFGKDVFSYVLMIAGFASTDYVFALTDAGRAPANSDTTYTIRDGARIIRVPVADILAITSAGNYVEFVLRDGRRPLMRSPLSAIEAELTPRGFVRVHRSWLVNAMQMTGLKPEGSGDYTVELGTLTVPLSRRFPDALAKLRAG